MRKALFERTARRWSIQGHTQKDAFYAEIFWHSRTYKPRILIHRADGEPGEVGVNELSLAGIRKYMALSKAVQEWRRGKGMLPEGDVPFESKPQI